MDLLYLGNKKRCSKCRQYKDMATEYHREERKKCGVKSQCIACRLESNKTRGEKKQLPRSPRYNPLIWVGDKRRCSKCRKYKAYNLFHKNSAMRNGIASQCKDCYNARHRKYHGRVDYFWKQFHKKTQRVGDCLEWIGAYANVTPACAWNGKKNASVRRVVYQLSCGELPDDMYVTPICKNIRCVRQSHLKRITEDEFRTNLYNSHHVGPGSHPGPGKRPEGWRGYHKPFPCGEQHHNAKLDPNKVREIRSRFAQGEGKRALARAFGVSHPALLCVLSGKTWGHVE